MRSICGLSIKPYHAGFGGAQGILSLHDQINLHLMFRQAPLVPVFSTLCAWATITSDQIMNFRPKRLRIMIVRLYRLTKKIIRCQLQFLHVINTHNPRQHKSYVLAGPKQ